MRLSLNKRLYTLYYRILMFSKTYLQLKHLFLYSRPEVVPEQLGGDVTNVDLNQPINEVSATLSKYPIKT
jgi:hypothetical protein